ncbi:hypothetical protein DmGdi_32180 [Gluconobacter sp. Gdi]|nr:hypothetical protein DmGdi_32180 [Gluconobacter sp. Gdi]
MCPDHGAVDHVGGGVALHYFSQRFQHRVEHASCNPAPIAAEHAVPLAVFVWQVSPLRACPRNPHHAFEIEAVILRRPPVQSVRPTLPPKDSLESRHGSTVNLCPQNQMNLRKSNGEQV